MASHSTLLSPSKEQQRVQCLKFIRFFIVKRIDGTDNTSFKNISPFLISKSIQSAIGDVKSIKKLQSGDLLLEVYSQSQSTTLSKMKTLGSFSIISEPHSSLNTSRGVISYPDLLHATESEIMENIKEQGVCNVRWITTKKNGKLYPTKHIVITFDTPTLPNRVKATYISCPVRPFIPNPLRCFNCQRFGHGKASCRDTVTCARCADVGYNSDLCKDPERCINCKGAHAAFSRSCPKWLPDKEIQTIKVLQNVSYIKARKNVNSRTPSIGKSYSSIAKPISVSCCSISTQTEDFTAVPSHLSKKTTCYVKPVNMPDLKLLPSSGEPVEIIYATSVKGESKKQLLVRPGSESQINSRYSPTHLSPKKSSSVKYKQSPPNPVPKKSTINKNKTLRSSPPFKRRPPKKNTKAFLRSLDETVESDVSYDSDMDDEDGNTVYEISTPAD